MICQVCGTVDNKNNRGPVKVRDKHQDEGGLCEPCNRWYAIKKIGMSLRFTWSEVFGDSK